MIWSPTAIAVGVVVFNLDSALTQVDEAAMLIGACAAFGLIFHFIINWIFQVNERVAVGKEQAHEESDDRPLLPDEYMKKNSLWHILICLSWLVFFIWLGNSRHGFPTPYWGMYSSMEDFINYENLMWPYQLIAFGGPILFLHLVKTNYLRYLKRLGY